MCTQHYYAHSEEGVNWSIYFFNLICWSWFCMLSLAVHKAYARQRFVRRRSSVFFFPWLLCFQNEFCLLFRIGLRPPHGCFGHAAAGCVSRPVGRRCSASDGDTILLLVALVGVGSTL